MVFAATPPVKPRVRRASQVGSPTDFGDSSRIPDCVRMIRSLPSRQGTSARTRARGIVLWDSPGSPTRSTRETGRDFESRRRSPPHRLGAVAWTHSERPDSGPAGRPDPAWVLGWAGSEQGRTCRELWHKLALGDHFWPRRPHRSPWPPASSGRVPKSLCRARPQTVAHGPYYSVCHRFDDPLMHLSRNPGRLAPELSTTEGDKKIQKFGKVGYSNDQIGPNGGGSGAGRIVALPRYPAPAALRSVVVNAESRNFLMCATVILGLIVVLGFRRVADRGRRRLVAVQPVQSICSASSWLRFRGFLPRDPGFVRPISMWNAGSAPRTACDGCVRNKDSPIIEYASGLEFRCADQGFPESVSGLRNERTDGTGSNRVNSRSFGTMPMASSSGSAAVAPPENRCDTDETESSPITHGTLREVQKRDSSSSPRRWLRDPVVNMMSFPDFPKWTRV